MPPILTWPRPSAVYALTIERNQIAGKPTSLTSEESDKYLITSYLSLINLSRASGISMASKNMSLNTTLNSGMQTLKAEDYSTPTNSSFFFAFMSFFSEKNTTNLHPRSSESSNVLSNSQVTYGQSSIPSLDDSTHHPLSSNFSVTFSHELMLLPARNEHYSPLMGSFNNYSIPSPFIFSYINDSFPFV